MSKYKNLFFDFSATSAQETDLRFQSSLRLTRHFWWERFDCKEEVKCVFFFWVTSNRVALA